MLRVFIGIGSNVEREANIRRAVAALQAQFGEVKCSPVYRTPAVGFVGDDFYNLVVEIETDLTVETLAAELRQIELHQGRHRGEAKFAPRTLDLDLLTYGATIGTYGMVVLPRPDILEYPFVLGPLADLAPELCHPTVQRTYRELWQGRIASEPLTPVPNFLSMQAEPSA
ncbi:MAG: 2-amino-4-hydroxy-6-hydroxymethyldihydropteridine diphosphokinase [Gammaproteobacteria bacterium]|nr:2-amino-4-hydroxy-6-hydroxymethyldihydropteridine diphosphokinase [Gammaproteobacteria bacterium]